MRAKSTLVCLLGLCTGLTALSGCFTPSPLDAREPVTISGLIEKADGSPANDTLLELHPPLASAIVARSAGRVTGRPPRVTR